MTTTPANLQELADHILASLARPIARIRIDGRVEYFELGDINARDKLNMLYHETGSRLVETAQGSGDLLLWVDEEGKLRHRPVNRVATALHQNGNIDPIVGDAVATGHANCDTAPLTQQQIIHLLATALTASVSVRGEDR